MTFKLEWIIIVDLLILMIMVFNIFKGFKNGFLVSLVNVVRFVVALAVASFFSGPVAKVFPLINLNTGGLDLAITQAMGIRGSESIWFLIIFIGVYLLSKLIIPLIRLIDVIPIVNSLNNLLGIVFGTVLGWLKVLILFFIFTLPVFSNGEVVIQESRLRHFESSIGIIQVFSDSMEDNLIFQKIVLDKPLNEQQEAEVQQWLESMNMDEESIIEFLERFK